MGAALHHTECTSTGGDGISRRGVEDFRLFNYRDARGDAVAGKPGRLSDLAAERAAEPGRETSLGLCAGDLTSAGPPVLHAVHAGPARYARDAVYAAGAASVPGRPVQVRGASLGRARSREGDRCASTADSRRGALDGSQIAQRNLVVCSALLGAGGLVLRSLAGHRPLVRRSWLHALQSRLRAQSGPRGSVAGAPHLLFVPRRFSVGWHDCDCICVAPRFRVFDARLEDHVGVHRLTHADGESARRRGVGTLSIARDSADLHCDDRGLVHGIGAGAHR